NEISYKIRGAIFEVYNNLGPGLLESIYEEALCYELTKAGLRVAVQVPLEVLYDGIPLKQKFRMDMVVEDLVVIEIKSVEEICDLHHKQLLTYLKLSNKKLGILVNFNSPDISKAIFRKVNGL
ncbi:MAG TPA: GxxExxY protein, partial [Cyclobacteriaceae bacterium]|nr:GxxExxY protein [Cyclobacteriaceae bacterium]